MSACRFALPSPCRHSVRVVREACSRLCTHFVKHMGPMTVTMSTSSTNQRVIIILAATPSQVPNHSGSRPLGYAAAPISTSAMMI